MRKGIGSTVDILFLGLIVSISLLLLIGSVQTNENKNSFADERAQNTLLIIQKVPVEQLGGISYKSNLSTGRTTTRELERKTLSKVIKEEVLLNPILIRENRVVEPKTNRGLTLSLENLIRSFLDVSVGKRFDYRFKIRMEPVKISENTSIFYKNDISEISPGSEKICSETVKLFISLHTFENRPDDELVPIFLTLELWSK